MDKITRRLRWFAVLACAFAALFGYLASSASKQSVQIPVSPRNSVHAVTAEDIGLYRAFLTQVKTDRSLPNYDPRIKTVLMGDRTVHLLCVNSTVSADNIGPLSRFTTHDRESLDPIPYNDKFNLLRASLLARNKVSVTIPGFKTPMPVAFAPPSRFGSDEHTDEWSNCDMHFSLPAYSADGTFAFLYFYSESDTLVEGGSLYVMRRHGASWSIDDEEPTLCVAEVDR
jgi:hypothetical protein